MMMIGKAVMRAAGCSAAAMVLLLTAGVASSGVVLGQGSGDRRAASFQAADSNHDGKVSRSEFEAFAMARLNQASGPRAAMFKRLPPDEQKARLDARFAAMDPAGKGYLTMAEWKKPS